MALGLLRGHQAAVGAQEGDAPGHVGAAQLLAQAADIAADHRPHRGVGHGGQGALVLLHLGQDLVGEGDGQVGEHLLGDLAHAPLVDAVEIAVHQGDGDRLDPLVLQPGQVAADFGLVERLVHLALGVDPAADLHGVFEQGQRRGLGPDDPGCQAAGHQGAGDLHHLPKAPGGHQADAGALAFQDGVGGHRGAVQEDLDLARLDLGAGADGLQADHDSLGAVVGRRGRLVAPEVARLVVEQEQVGERAPDIHA
jgi:hypothetical protein